MNINRKIALILFASTMSFASNDTGLEAYGDCENNLQQLRATQEECRQLEDISKWAVTFAPSESESFSGEDFWLILDYFFPREDGCWSCAGRLDDAQLKLDECEARAAE